jgi:hypothetical protein
MRTTFYTVSIVVGNIIITRMRNYYANDRMHYYFISILFIVLKLIILIFLFLDLTMTSHFISISIYRSVI